MERIKVTTKAQLDALEKNSAHTWVGLIADDENLKATFDWIERFTPVRTRRAHEISVYNNHRGCGIMTTPCISDLL